MRDSIEIQARPEGINAFFNDMELAGYLAWRPSHKLFA